MANHISWLAAIAVLAAVPVTFVAKHEVAGWPLVGRAATRMGTHYVDRTGWRGLRATVRGLAAELRRGRTVMVFPAGTTWCRPPGGRFHAPMFQAALDTGVPVRPVTIAYTQRGRTSTVAAFVGEDTLVASIARVLRARDLVVHIRPHEPLKRNPALPDAAARQRLAREAYDVIGTIGPGRDSDRPCAPNLPGGIPNVGRWKGLSCADINVRHSSWSSWFWRSRGW
ncbi:hypothetical protein GCM10029964_086090 [Kibdelosporangium lantanae]